ITLLAFMSFHMVQAGTITSGTVVVPYTAGGSGTESIANLYSPVGNYIVNGNILGGVNLACSGLCAIGSTVRLTTVAFNDLAVDMVGSATVNGVFYPLVV